MFSYLIRRSGLSLTSIWAVLTIVFILVRILPGNPAQLMLGIYASPEMIAHQEQLMGLDKPIGQQYLSYLKQISSGNWGRSLFSQHDVIKMIRDTFPRTIALSLFGLCVALLFAFPIGIWAGVHVRSASSRILVTLSMLGQSMAPFWVGIVLILVFSRWLKWLPSFGYGGLSHFVLPGLAVGLPLMGVLSRLIRSEVSDQMAEDYVRTARSKGLSEGNVIIHHALRNSMISILVVIGMQLGSLLAGSIVVETVFSWPGIGRLMISTLSSRDYPVIQVAVAITATAYVLLNLGVDLLLGVLNPRIRYE